jgi:hypothetical protein
MSVKRFRQKPREQPKHDDLYAAQYHVGSLEEVREVARMAYQGELAECPLPSGTVLVAAWTDVPDCHPSEKRYAEVRDGDWLYYSESYGSLGDDTTKSLAHWYEEVT